MIPGGTQEYECLKFFSLILIDSYFSLVLLTLISFESIKSVVSCEVLPLLHDFLKSKKKKVNKIKVCKTKT